MNYEMGAIQAVTDTKVEWDKAAESEVFLELFFRVNIWMDPSWFLIQAPLENDV